MAMLIHEVWVELDQSGQKLHSCIMAGPRGDRARAYLLADGAKLAWTFKAGSHFEAMTFYHRRAHDEVYTTDQAWDFEPYPQEWADDQNVD
jgi:hypothetical protein